MVGDLFQTDRAAVDGALVSFTYDGVERFVHRDNEICHGNVPQGGLQHSLLGASLEVRIHQHREV